MAEEKGDKGKKGESKRSEKGKRMSATDAGGVKSGKIFKFGWQAPASPGCDVHRAESAQTEQRKGVTPPEEEHKEIHTHTHAQDKNTRLQ